MNRLQDVWNKLNGSKTLIGTFLAVVYLGAVAQGLIDRNDGVEFLITTVLGVGLGHKVVKTTRE